MTSPTNRDQQWFHGLQKEAANAVNATYLVWLGAWEVLEAVGSKVQAKLPLLGARKSPIHGSERKSLEGKVCVITGGNAGVGEATAAELLQYGAHVVLACRSTERARAAVLQLQSQAGKSRGQVEAMSLDLGSLHSVRQFAKDFKSKGLALDVLVNNAGVMAPPKRGVTVDGYEEQFQVNHLGHFLLTHELLKQREQLLTKPQGRVTGGPAVRVVNLTSMVHMGGNIHLDDLHFEHRYNAFAAYAQSKLANVLFTKELQRRHDPRDLVAVAVHPGLVDTALARSFFKNQVPYFLHPLLTFMFPVYLRTTSEAVENVMMAVLGPADIVAGKYIAGCKVMKGSSRSDDARLADELWRLSEKLAGISE